MVVLMSTVILTNIKEANFIFFWDAKKENHLSSVQVRIFERHAVYIKGTSI